MKLTESQWTALSEKISARQLLAFRLIYSEGLTYEKAGKIMNIKQNTVAELIGRLRKDYPDCIPKHRPEKMLRFNPAMDDGQIKEKW